jgi:hypothetical protein
VTPDVRITLASRADLCGITALQRANLKSALSPAESREQGFVTLVHSLDALERMHELAPSVVAKIGEEVVGYALTMLLSARPLVPGLEPMFAALGGARFRDQPLEKMRFYVMGQVCVARGQRGSGVFSALYAGHDAHYGDRFDCIVTEVSATNARSLRAHGKVGFERSVSYGHDAGEWIVLTRALNARTP